MALVQEQSTTGAAVTSLAAILAANTGSGNLLIAFISASPTSTVAPTITAPAGWLQADISQPTAKINVAIFYLPNTTAGVKSFTFTFSLSSNVDILLQEWPGVATSSPLDVHANNSTNTATVTTGTTGTTAQPSELVVWCLGYDQSTVLTYSGLVGSFTADTNNTVQSTGAPNTNLAVWYETVSATGTQSSGVTLSAVPSGAGGHTGVVIATFKLSTGNSLAAPARGHFLNAAALVSDTRQHFLGRAGLLGKAQAIFEAAFTGHVPQRVTFKLALHAKVENRSTFQARAGFAVQQRSHFLSRTSLTEALRSTFKLANVRALLAQARTHFLSSASLHTSTRSHVFTSTSFTAKGLGHFLTHTAFATASRSHFLSAVAVKVQSRSHFLSAVVLANHLRGHTFTHTVLSIATRTHVLVHTALHTVTQTTFKLSNSLTHLLVASSRMVFVSRARLSSPAHLRFLSRTSLLLQARTRFLSVFIGHVQSRVRFLLAAHLKPPIRAIFSSHAPLGTTARSRFAIRGTFTHLLVRPYFHSRTQLVSPARVRTTLRSLLVTQARARSALVQRLLSAVQSRWFGQHQQHTPGRGVWQGQHQQTVTTRSRFAARSLRNVVSHARFSVRTAFAAGWRGTFKVKQSPSLPLQAAFSSAINRLSATFAEASSLSASFASTSLLAASFVRSPALANPNSTITVSATVKDSNGNLLANLSAFACVVTFPDGTTSTPVVTNAGGGVYTTTYTTKGVGECNEDWTFTAADGTTKLEAHNVTPVSY